MTGAGLMCAASAAGAPLKTTAALALKEMMQHSLINPSVPSLWVRRAKGALSSSIETLPAIIDCPLQHAGPNHLSPLALITSSDRAPKRRRAVRQHRDAAGDPATLWGRVGALCGRHTLAAGERTVILLCAMALYWCMLSGSFSQTYNIRSHDFPAPRWFCRAFGLFGRDSHWSNCDFHLTDSSSPVPIETPAKGRWGCQQHDSRPPAGGLSGTAAYIADLSERCPSAVRNGPVVHAAIVDYHQWQWPCSPCSNCGLPSMAMAL